jgi:hypothetical protein
LIKTDFSLISDKIHLYIYYEMLKQKSQQQNNEDGNLTLFFIFLMVIIIHKSILTLRAFIIWEIITTRVKVLCLTPIFCKAHVIALHKNTHNMPFHLVLNTPMVGAPALNLGAFLSPICTSKKSGVGQRQKFTYPHTQIKSSETN